MCLATYLKLAIVLVISELSLGQLDYQGCGAGGDRLCLGRPAGCVDTNSCQILYKSRFNSATNRLNSDLSSLDTTMTRYIAVALSLDNRMGDDSVSDCSRLSDGMVVNRISFNTASPKANAARNVDGFTTILASVGSPNGVLRCQWDRNAVTTHDNFVWDLRNTSYFLLLGFGNLNQQGVKSYHGPGNYLVSGQAVILANASGTVATVDVTFLTQPLAKAHAILMVMAWLGLVPIGILFARHGRDLFPGHVICGVKTWFAVHRPFMVVAFVFAIVGVTCMIFNVGGFSGFRLHPNLGILATLFMLSQVISALLRCHPGDKNRWIFDMVHKWCGYVAHLFAGFAIYFAAIYVQRNLQASYRGLFIAEVVIYILAHVVLELKACVDKRSKKKSDESLVTLNTVEVEKISNNDTFVLVILGMFIFVNTTLMLLICLTIYNSS